jgi:hypothetical protein
MNAQKYFSAITILNWKKISEANISARNRRGTLRKYCWNLCNRKRLWDNHFISMEAQNEGWLLHFKNGSSPYADIVIAADGANSKIRPYITPIKAFYSGITMLEGNIYDRKSSTAYESFSKWWKNYGFRKFKRFIHRTEGNGDIGFGASFKADENWASNNGLDYTDKNRSELVYNSLFRMEQHLVRAV